MAYRLQADVGIPPEEEEWIPIGEALSAEDVQLAAVTLYERKVPFHWAYAQTEVEGVRRVIEEGPAGQLLLVRPKDAEAAAAIVGYSLAPMQHWASVESYLCSRPTDDILKILDFEKLWSKSILNAASNALHARGMAYPPSGVPAPLLPLNCLMMGLWLGPFAGVMQWKIDQKDPVPSGGMRPRHDSATKKKASAYLVTGIAVWMLLVLAAVVLRAID